MDPKKIGEFLKVLRREKGLTQEQLAEVLPRIKKKRFQMGNGKQYARSKHSLFK